MKINKAKSKNASTSIPLFAYTLDKSKSVITLCTLMCMSLSSSTLAALGEIDARSLMNSTKTAQRSQSNASPELDSLQQQLQDKTKELEEYKAKLFRGSHPEDQAKIIALSRRVAENESARQKLTAEIQALENELASTRKQIETLEASSKSLSALIEGQRVTADTERNNLLAKIREYEEEISKERTLSAKLQEELSALQEKLAYNENVLQDLLQETAMLKFELADVRKTIQEKEQDLARTIERYENERQASAYSILETEEALAKQSKELDALKERLEAESLAKAQVLEQKERAHAQHDAERQALVTQLLDKEETLEKSVADYQSAITSYIGQVNELQQKLESERNSNEHLDVALTEKIEALKATHSTLSDTKAALAKALHDYQTANDTFRVEIQEVRDQLASEQEAKRTLQSEKGLFTAQHAIQIKALENALAAKGAELNDAIAKAQSQMGSASNESEGLKATLAQAEQARSQLQKAHDQLNAEHAILQEALNRHVAEKLSLEIVLKEKEDALKSAILLTEGSVAEHRMQIDALKAQLAQEEATNKNLQLGHEDLAAYHKQLSESILKLEQDKVEMTRVIAAKEAALQQAKEEMLTAADSQHQEQVEALKNSIAQLENDRQKLQQAYDELTDSHQQLAERVTWHEQQGKELESAVAEKDAALQRAKDELLAAASLQHQEQNEELQATVSQLQDDCQRLQQAYNDVLSQRDQLTQTLTVHELEKEDLLRDIATKEAALQQAKEEMLSHDNSHHQELIGSLQTKISELEAECHNLEQARSEISAQRNQLAETLAIHEQEKEEMAREIAAKEAALQQAKEEMLSHDNSHHQELLGALQTKISQLETDCHNLQQTRNDLSAQRDELAEALASRETEKEEMAREIAAKEAALQQAKDEMLASADSQHHDLLAKIAQIEADCRTMQQAHHDMTAHRDELAQTLITREQEKEEMAREIAAKEAALQQAKEEMLASADSQHQTLLDKIARLEADCHNLQQAQNNVSAQRDQLAKTLASRELEKDEMAREMAAKEAALQQAKEEMHASAGSPDQDLLGKIARLEADCLNLQQAQNDVSAQRDQLAKTLASRELEKDEMAREMAAKEAALQQAKEEMHASAGSPDQDLLGKIAKLQADCLVMQQAHNDVSAMRDQFAQTLASRDLEKDEMAREIAAKEAALQQAKEEMLASADSQHQALLAKIAQLEAECHTMQQAHNDVSAQRDQLAQTLASRELEKDEMAREIAAKEAAVQQAKEEMLASADSQHQSLVAKIAQLEAECRTMQQAHNDSSAERDQLAEILARHELEKDAMANEIAAKEAALQQAKEEMHASADSQHQALLAKIAQLEADYYTMQQAHNDSLAQREQLAQTLASRETERENLARSIQDKEAILAQAKAEIMSLSAAQTSALATLQKRIDDQEAENTLLQTQFEAQRSDLLTKLEEQFNELSNLQNNLNAMAQKNAEATQLNSELDNKLRQLADNAASNQSNEAQALQATNARLSETLHSTENELLSLKQQIAEIEKIAAAKDNALKEQQLLSMQELQKIKEQLDADRVLIETLRSENEKIAAATKDKSRKEEELERSIQSLTVIAQHQDQALAEANSTFSLVQDYNHQLESENVELRNRLAQAEIAQRELKMALEANGDNVAERTSSAMPPAILNLLQRSVKNER